MSDVVIRAEGLGKKYTIGHRAERGRYTALRDVIAQRVRTMTQSAMNLIHGRSSVAGDELEEFWALRDLNFEVRRGEVIGIIGRNGAGKSTLLKILSRITEPTEGRVTIRGRVASLLEVGTGFHPELTGRENVFLNGAILGMTRAEINRRFDEIVDFAGVERFLDTPVKRYSSGMYVRLAFAVAAHLEPEILVVDEVLAVGDTEFQRKCLGKMRDVAGHGRTVIVVSHQLQAVSALCERALWIEQGNIEHIGKSDKIISLYSKFNSDRTRYRPSQVREREGVKIANASCEFFPSAEGPGRLLFHISVESSKLIDNFVLEIGIRDRLDQKISHLRSNLNGKSITLQPGLTIFSCNIQSIPLFPGQYTVNIALTRFGDVLYSEINSTYFEISSTEYRYIDTMPDYGPLILKQCWNII